MGKNNSGLKYKLSSVEKERLLDEIKYYFESERGEQLGVIASGNVLDFFLETLGKHIYNKGLEDAKDFYEQRFANLESDFYAMFK